MKKNIYTVIGSIIVSVLTTYYLFQNQWGHDCLGCGLAPDGKTWLGPFVGDYISYSLLGLFVFIVVFLFLSIIIKFIRRLSK